MAQTFLRYARKFGSAYTPAGGGDVNTAQPEFNPEVQRQRAGSGEAGALAPMAGAAVGGAVGGPVGSVVGGGAGGFVGQVASNAMAGKPLTEGAMRETALGALTGFVPEARPLLGVATRVGGTGLVEGANEALTKPNATYADIAGAAGKGAALQAGGEGVFRVFGTALGRSGAHFEDLKPAAQQEIRDAAEVVARGKPEMPKAPPGGAVSEAAKTEHEAALKEYDDAIESIKSRHFDPEDVVHAVAEEKEIRGHWFGRWAGGDIDCCEQSQARDWRAIERNCC